MTENPKVTLPAKVETVANEPEKVQISVDGADTLYQEIRIENKLKDENGNEVRLNKGAEVEVTIEAPQHAFVPTDTGDNTSKKAS